MYGVLGSGLEMGEETGKTGETGGLQVLSLLSILKNTRQSRLVDDASCSAGHVVIAIRRAQTLRSWHPGTDLSFPVTAGLQPTCLSPYPGLSLFEQIISRMLEQIAGLCPQFSVAEFHSCMFRRAKFAQLIATPPSRCHGKPSKEHPRLFTTTGQSSGPTSRTSARRPLNKHSLSRQTARTFEHSCLLPKELLASFRLSCAFSSFPNGIAACIVFSI